MIKLNKVTRDCFEACKDGEYYVSITFRRGVWEARISDDEADRHTVKVFDLFKAAHEWCSDVVSGVCSSCVAWMD